MGNRPIRERIEDRLQEFEGGPLRFSGQGNLVGGAGYLGVQAVNNTLILGSLGTLGGVNVGYRVISHSVEERVDDELHTFNIHAWSQDVAQFAAKYLSAPSNFNFAVGETNVLSVENIQDRRTSPTWRIKIEVEPRTEEGQIT